MPIFQFKCTYCLSVFEQLVFDRNQPVSCISCGSNEVTRFEDLMFEKGCSRGLENYRYHFSPFK